MAGTPTDDCFCFTQLIQAEDAWLEGRKGGPLIALNVTVPGSFPNRAALVDEPFVAFTNRDRLGLALSGGGMRSASFNLGLLQALGAKGVLGHVDYLSTVSGGGYIGGFWSALRLHRKKGVPAELGARPVGTLEPLPIRHLREFSRFLMPRTGFFKSESWAGVIAVLGGMLPALIMTLALVTVGVALWLAGVYSLLTLPPMDSALLFADLTFAIHSFAELSWWRDGKAGDARKVLPLSTLMILLCAVLSLGAWLGTRKLVIPLFAQLSPLESLPARPDHLISWLPAWSQFGLRLHTRTDPWVLHSMMPALAWTALGVVLLIAHALTSRSNAVATRALYRTTARFFAPAILWAGAVVIWWAARELVHYDVKNADVQGPLAATAGSAVASGGLFVWLRDWLKKAPSETNASSLLKRLSGVLKPLAPQLLAAAAALLIVTLFAGLIVHFVVRDYAWLGLSAAVGLLVLGGFTFDPRTVGLHDFYRSRIARCFLGAAADDPTGNRPTELQPRDDFPVAELKDHAYGPLHLVCCAANNLAGDTLSSLYRGARSAAVSPLAISVGGFAASPGTLKFSSALTASAAAFNSQMGMVSMEVGSSVAFLMTVLNLRLGLWVPHPLSRSRRATDWLTFFREATAGTRCDPVPVVAANKLLDSAKNGGVDRQVLQRDDVRFPGMHLSDGGHFENLGLYELVRRHCRYIIVSDASADPEAAFDDLANAIRRVREDFSVEIDLDVTPLKPADGISKQHAVVGTIHYDTLGGTDKGTILYFKPTLVGDEPADVTQYRARNQRFPHESTADQFYDEAQWESYRRLGEHEAGVVLRFLESAASGPSFVDSLFMDARQLWQRAPDHQRDDFLELTRRCADIESEIIANAPQQIRAEMFPEVAQFRPTPLPQLSDDDQLKSVFWMMQIAQVMEDVWLGAQLDRYWSHPLNEGWMNYFERWASTPTFRKWWPLLRPMFSVGFRDFVRDRFDLKVRADTAPGALPRVDGAVLRVGPFAPASGGHAWAEWQRHGGARLTGRDLQFLQCTLTLAGTPTPLQVGVFAYERSGNVAEWTPEVLYVPAPLVGGGIIARFLDGIVVELGRAGVEVLRVKLTPDGRRDPASRNALAKQVAFYKSRDFTYADAGVLERRLGTRAQAGQKAPAAA